jgi:hypothetical protein
LQSQSAVLDPAQWSARCGRCGIRRRPLACMHGQRHRGPEAQHVLQACVPQSTNAQGSA